MSASPRRLTVPAAAAARNAAAKEKRRSEGTTWEPQRWEACPRGQRRMTPGQGSLSFANGNCVEVADLSGGQIGVRNSRDSRGPVLRFTPDEWRTFIGGVRNGEFDGFGMS